MGGRGVPATPAPVTVRNFRRLMEGEGLRAGRGSRIVSLLGCPDTNSPKGLASLCFQTATCQVVSAALPSPDAILALMRRPLLALLIVLAAIGVFAGGLAWLLDTPRPPAGPAPGAPLQPAR